MRLAALLLSAAAACAWAQTPDVQRAVLERLAREADLFDKSAYRYAGTETLKQVQPRGSRVSRGPRGTEAVLPEQTREVVSDYGFIALDERGGWIKEVRVILTVDGLRWNKGKKGLENLAGALSANDDKKKRSLLESYEDFGLQGFVTDLGPLILLFARGLVSNYELTYERTDTDDRLGPLLVYRYMQLGGSDALTIYEGDEPIKQKLQGRIWFRQNDYAPVRISIDSEHKEKESVIRDVSVVEYDNRQFGFVLPSRITHQQYVDQVLFVSDEFTYSGFREVLSGGRPR